VRKKEPAVKMDANIVVHTLKKSRRQELGV